MTERQERGSILHSFEVAFRGMGEAWSRERNFRVQLGYTVVVMGLLLWLRPERTEALLVGLSLFVLLSAELMNTALERTVDLAMSDQHPLARSAKDIAAGSVLMIAIGSGLLSLSVLAPYLPLNSLVALLGLQLGVVAFRFTGGWDR